MKNRILSRHSLMEMNYCIDKIAKKLSTGVYIRRNYQKKREEKWLEFRKNMKNVCRDLYIVLVLASAQVCLLFKQFDTLSFLMIMLFIVFLLTQQFQQNYFTPHFNPIWVPICILAAKTTQEVWPYFFDGSALSWVIVIFAGIEMVRIGRILIKSFSENEKDTFGLGTPLLGMLFRLPEVIGEYIQRNTKETEKIFVWGDQPSIYLYAGREVFSTGYLIPYGPHKRILGEKRLIDCLRENPPEVIVFYNFKVNDGWNINRLQEAIGVRYKYLTSFNITDEEGKIVQDEKGVVYDFPMYRRDDSKYKEILLDRGLMAAMSGDGEEAKREFGRMLEIFPDDYEVSIRLLLLQGDTDSPEAVRTCLGDRSKETTERVQRAVLMRMLAEVDHSEGKWDSAIEKFEKALDHNPKDFRAFNGLGEVYLSMGETGKAFDSLKRAIALNPSSSEALNNLGKVSARLNKRESALLCFQKALSIMPDHPDALLFMAEMLTNGHQDMAHEG